MSQNPFEALLRSFESVARSVQAHVSRLFPADPQEQRGRHPKRRSESSSSVPPPAVISMPSTTAAEMEDLFPLRPKEDFSESGPRPKEKSSGAVSKEELGRATWTLLHMIAAKFPERPTRQQRRDAKELMAIISRLYPCKECADHFKEILSDNPVMAGSQEEFSQWLCHVHNVVNRSCSKGDLGIVQGPTYMLHISCELTYVVHGYMNSLGKPIFPCQRIDARWNKLDCEGRGCDLDGSSDSSGLL